MSATPPEPAWQSATSLESLAERLRQGPFRTVLTLHVRMCAAARVADSADQLQKHVELLQLAQMSMAQLRDLTFELKSRIDQLAETETKLQ